MKLVNLVINKNEFKHRGLLLTYALSNIIIIVSDGERKVGNRSPSPKAGGMGSIDHTFIKDEVNAV